MAWGKAIALLSPPVLGDTAMFLRTRAVDDGLCLSYSRDASFTLMRFVRFVVH